MVVLHMKPSASETSSASYILRSCGRRVQHMLLFKGGLNTLLAGPDAACR